jgi:hypothetical protein
MTMSGQTSILSSFPMTMSRGGTLGFHSALTTAQRALDIALIRDVEPAREDITVGVGVAMPLVPCAACGSSRR